MRLLSVTSVFFSALLAFSVEPLIAKRLLPTFGGSAAVWVTCLVTFQGLLLLGYVYADLLLRAPRKAQIPIHAAVLLLPFATMPFATPHAPTPGAAPMGALVVELLRSVALPFFALSTNSTLVQHWYAKRTGQAPWFLYAASNAGSLAGLLGYPVLVEPFVGLAAQSVRWMIGYVAFAALTGVVVWIAARESASAPPTSPKPPRVQVVRWVVRSAIGAMLLCSVSFWVTLDVAALPLLWVVPLALYLLTFVIAFSPRVPFPRRILAILCMLFVILGLESIIGSAEEAGLLLVSAFGALFLGAWLVHGDLARDRPPEDRLSAYYLWIALGGFLGGVAGNVLAPNVFDSVAEYPLALGVLAFAVAAETGIGSIRETFAKPSTWVAVAVMVALLALTTWGFRGEWGLYVMQLPVAVLLAGVVFRSRPGLFGAGAMLTALFVSFGLLRTTPVLDADRSFYGTLRIHEKDGVRTMVHGTTLHGVERVGSAAAPPGAYYHPQGPLGSSMTAFPDGGRVGVIGLGAGALAVLSKPAQELVYFEIDATVERLARTWFTYLARSPAAATVKIGDARLTLQDEPDASFDGLVVDAFSSDSVPVHLLTEEAAGMYLAKLREGGVAVFHVSNRFFDLRRVVKGAADGNGALAVWMPWAPAEALMETELATDTWAVAIARSESALAPWRALGWEPLTAPPVRWTDDHSSLVPLLGRKPKLAPDEVVPVAPSPAPASSPETRPPLGAGTASTAAATGGTPADGQ